MRHARRLINLGIALQALVFVTRTMRHSFADRAGGLTYIAFICAQVGSCSCCVALRTAPPHLLRRKLGRTAEVCMRPAGLSNGLSM